MPPAQTADAATRCRLMRCCWQQAMARLAGKRCRRAVCTRPNAVVLLPYAQLIQQARQAWAAQAGRTFFVPAL
jgi:ATP-dependent helicase/nuclease subunit B